jgi:hypothetical protein
MFFTLQEAIFSTSPEYTALLDSLKAGTLAPAGLFWASCKVKNL